MTAPQYFEDFIPLGEGEVFLDCGAYNGDSALSFIEALKRRGITSYDKIISFEPDPYNYEAMVKRGLEKHQCINKATSDHVDIMRFSIKGTSSVFDEHGDITVDINSIDNLIHEKVTYLKMDIEGAELESLRGAERTIRKYRPKLAICIYHKKEDLWQIQQYIESLDLGYQFYIRAYERSTIELVLYAL